MHARPPHARPLHARRPIVGAGLHLREQYSGNYAADLLRIKTAVRPVAGYNQILGLIDVVQIVQLHFFPVTQEVHIIAEHAFVLPIQNLSVRKINRKIRINCYGPAVTIMQNQGFFVHKFS